MRLLKITLENFQEFKSVSFDFGGKSAIIYGDNGTGKTTLCNAFTWLFFGKDSAGTKNYSPKTKTKDGDAHHLEHSSEATIQMEDGRIYTFKKVLKEKWSKKRGSIREEFDGHTIEYYVDEVPTTEKDYQSLVTSLFGGDSEKPKMLTVPGYFPERMDWKERRKILISICGDVADEDIIDAYPGLNPLKESLLIPGTFDRRYTVDEYRKIANDRRLSINKKLDQIPSRIDEAERAIPETECCDMGFLKSSLEKLQKDLQDAENRKGGSEGSKAASLDREIAKLNADIEKERMKHTEQHYKASSVRNEKISAIKSSIFALSNEIKEHEYMVRSINRDLENLERTREKIRAEIAKVRETQFGEEKAICPTCGRPYPESDVEKMREQFNEQKSKQLEELTQRGKTDAGKEMILKLNEEKAKANSKIENLIMETERLNAELEGLNNVPITVFEQTEVYSDLKKRLSEATAERKELGTNTEFDEEIASIQESIRKTQEMIAALALAEAQRERIRVLEGEEMNLAKEKEKCERDLYLCDLFTQAKISELDEKINGKFQNVKFRLFREQMNGATVEDCEVLVPNREGNLVPYPFANSASKINAGLEIIDALSEHWNLRMPLWVDNAESIVRLQEIDTQVIRLIVSAGDSKLRMEIL